MWVFAKALFQGEQKAQDWVLVYYLHRVDVTPTAVTQAMTSFQHLRVHLTDSTHQKQAYSSQHRFCHGYYIGLRGFISSGLILRRRVENIYVQELNNLCGQVAKRLSASS